MAKAFVTSLSLHAAAVGLLIWATPESPPHLVEQPQFIELQPMTMISEAPPEAAPAPEAPPEPVQAEAPPEPPPPVPEPPPEPPPPVEVAELPPPPEPPPLDIPLPEPPPEIVPEDLIRSATPPVAELPPPPPPPPPKPKPAPKPRPVVAKSPPAVPKPPQDVVQAAEIVPEPVPPAAPSPVAARDPAPTVAIAPPAPPAVDTDYLAKIAGRLARYRNDAARAMRGVRQGQAVIEFTLSRDGTVISKKLVASSGIEGLDRAALNMIERASPMPALPASYAGDTWTMTVPVNFKLE